MTKPLHILLADDDSDDRFFFEKAIKLASTPSFLTTVDNGERLMQFLTTTTDELPDALFLDLNMPRKNGSECLREIKMHEKLNALPVIIYSTSLHVEIADLLYKAGAYYYIKKTNLLELQKFLDHVLSMLSNGKLTRPSREQFILNSKIYDNSK